MEPLPKSKRGVIAPSTALQLALLFTSTACYVVVIFYASVTERAEVASNKGLPLSDWLKVGVGTTLTVVRVLQGVLSAACAIAAARALLFLQWCLIQRPEGLSYRSLLALSPSTLDSGIIRILFSRSSRAWTRLRCLMRYALSHLQLFSFLFLPPKSLRYRLRLTVMC
jgi:hypothetical protein